MIVKSHMGGGSFTRLNPIHTCTTVSHKKNPSLSSPPFSCHAPCTLEGRVPMWRTHIQTHVWYVHTWKWKHTHSVLSYIFTFTYAILSVHLHMQNRPDPFTHAKAIRHKLSITHVQATVKECCMPSFIHAIPLLSLEANVTQASSSLPNY